MQKTDKIQLARELAQLSHLLQADAVDGFLVISTHSANNTATVLMCPPTSKEGVEKFMAALDRTHFRAKVVCYLGPKGGALGIVEGTEVKQ